MQLKQFLERKDVFYWSVIAAIGIKTTLYLHFFQLEGDKLFQALGAKSLTEGRGITFQHVLASDLSTQITEAVNRWPIAYSLVLAPFYWITGNMEMACIIVDVLSICFLFIALFKLLTHLQLQRFLIVPIILFTGSTFGPYLSKPTDLLACAALIYACLLYLLFVSGRLRSAANGVAIGVATIVPAAFRYMYIPCAFVIPSVLLWLGYGRNDKRILRGGVYAMMTTVFLFAALTAIQQAIVGSSTYVMAAQKGFFPENLLTLYPFIPDAFFDINFVLQQVDAVTHVPFPSLYESLQYVNLLLLVILLYGWTRFMFRRQLSTWKPFDHFVALTVVISLSLLLLLGYLSVTNSAAPISLRTPFRWTYVADGRYFMFPVVILPVIAAYALFNKQWQAFRKFQRPLRYLFFLLIVFQLLHTLYFIGRRFDPLGLNGGNVLITRKTENYIRDRIVQAKQRGYDVILTGVDETVSNWATLHNEKGVLQLQELLATKVQPKKPSIVFVLISRSVLPHIKDTLTEKTFKTEKEIDGVSVFSAKYESIE
jgi:hypothetical protein